MLLGCHFFVKRQIHCVFLKVMLWRVHLTNTDILTYIKMTGFTWQKHQNLLAAHYNMDEVTSSTILYDNGRHENHGQIHNGEWV